MLIPPDELKEVIKVAGVEVLSERKEWFVEVVHELLDDYYLGKAMEEAVNSEAVDKKTMLTSLKNIDYEE